jgi:hypothetical protein
MVSLVVPEGDKQWDKKAVKPKLEGMQALPRIQE